MTERRQFPRFSAALEFYCYIDGDRFDSVSVDLSPAGVFLRTAVKVRPGAIVMLVPKDEAAKDFPVMLIGRMVRKQLSPAAPGYGVLWLRCVTRKGVEAIYHFIASYPEFSNLTLPIAEAEVLEASVVGYDFGVNRFYLPVIPGAGAPIPPSPFAAEPTDPLIAPHPESPSDFTRTAEDGAVTRALKVMHEQIPVSIATTVIMDGEEVFATVLMLSLTTLFITGSADRFQPGDQVRIRLPVNLSARQTVVELFCDVNSLGPHPALAGGSGIHLTLRAVDESRRVGLFERYVKFLYYQMLTMR